MKTSIISLKQKFLALELAQGEKMAKIYVVTGLTVFTFAQVLIKGSTLSVYQTLYFRGLIICCINIYFVREPLYIFEKYDRRLLLLQSFMASFQSFFYFTGLRYMSLSEGTCLYQTFAIWTQFQANWILNEPIYCSTIRNCIISLIGVVLITRPSVLFGSSEITIENEHHLLACICLLVASFIYGLSQTLLRILVVPGQVKLHYMHGWNIILGSLATVIVGELKIDIYNINNLLVISGISMSSYIAHLLLIRGYSMVSIAKIAPYTFSQLITALLCDFLIFQKLPDLIAIIGSSFIIFSIVLTSFFKEKR